MSDSFYGRTQELGDLSSQLGLATTAGRGRLIAIRGRRQVGKSRLIERFVESAGVPYGVVHGLKATPLEVQMRRALDTLRSSNAPLPGLHAVTGATPTSWFDLLSRLQLAMADGPAILVFDEFPWANETNPGLDGLLQSIWDRELSHRPVLILLIGSDSAMMETLFEHDRPLYGRLDHQLVLTPFNPVETSLALGSDRTASEVFDIHLVTGGLPELVTHARQFATLEQLVENTLSTPHNLLNDLASIELAGELSDSASARIVLEAIGAHEIGIMKFTDMTRSLGDIKNADTTVTRAVNLLSDTKGIIAVDLPAGERNSRLRRYRIADSYLRFWFRFIAPQLNYIEVGRPDIAIKAFHESWSTWRGKAIEPLLRQAFLRLARSLDPPLGDITSVAGWWNRQNHEYDLVGTSAKVTLPIAVGSIKWRVNRPFDRHDVNELAQARSVIPGASNSKLVALTATGTTSNLDLDLVLDAPALLEAWQ